MFCGPDVFNLPDREKRSSTPMDRCQTVIYYICTASRSNILTTTLRRFVLSFGHFDTVGIEFWYSVFIMMHMLIQAYMHSGEGKTEMFYFNNVI